MRRRYHFIYLVALLALVLIPVSLATAGTPIDESRTVSPGATVVVEIISGSVTVEGSSGDVVEISGTLGEGAKPLQITGDEQRLKIKVEHPRGARNVKPTILNINMPAGCTLDASGVSADVKVNGVDGDLTLTTVSGDIEARGNSRTATITTVSGDGRIYLPAERLEATTVSGDLIIEGAGGELNGESVSGSVSIDGGVFHRLDLETVSGDLKFEGDFEKDGRIECEAHSGDIVLHLPAGVGADFEVETFSGEIRNELGPNRESGRTVSGAELVFTTGGGGARVKVGTFSGDVWLKGE